MDTVRKTSVTHPYPLLPPPPDAARCINTWSVIMSHFQKYRILLEISKVVPPYSTMYPIYSIDKITALYIGFYVIIEINCFCIIIEINMNI